MAVPFYFVGEMCGSSVGGLWCRIVCSGTRMDRMLLWMV